MFMLFCSDFLGLFYYNYMYVILFICAVYTCGIPSQFLHKVPYAHILCDICNKRTDSLCFMLDPLCTLLINNTYNTTL